MGQCQSNPSSSSKTKKTKDEINDSTVEWSERLEMGGTFRRYIGSIVERQRQQSLIVRDTTSDLDGFMRSDNSNTVRRRSSAIRFYHNRSLGTTKIKRTSIYKDNSSVVMSTPSSVLNPWEARLAPGIYPFADLVKFPDIKPPVPRYTKFTLDHGSWKSTTGRLEIPLDALLSQEVPVEVATNSLLEFYGCSLIEESTGGSLELNDEHRIQDFTYQQDYFKKYVLNVGAGIETHEFAHIDCPLSPLDESGVFLLGKWEEEESTDNVNQPAKNNLCLTAFRIPQLHVLFVPEGTIHSNDYLLGCWRTMLSWTTEKPIDNVKIFGVSDGGDKQKGMFRIQGMNSADV